MKALFIGGTGVISTDITKLCVEKGWDITLLNRGNHNLGIKTNQWTLDINDESAVKAKLENESFDVIANFINFDVNQIERDIRLFSEKTKQYIFISTASAYQKPRSYYMTHESTPLSNPHWEYSRKKIVCEERLMTEYRQNGFPITIVRPSHTYNTEKVPIAIHGNRGSWSTLKRIMDKKPIIVPGDGNTLWTLTHSQDFAKAFEGLMGNTLALGESVHITTDEVLTWNQIYHAIGSALGVQPILQHVSTDFIVACNNDYEGSLHGDKSTNGVFDNSKIKRLVPSFTATMRFDQGVKISVDNHLTNPALQIDDPDFDRFCDAIVKAQAEAMGKVLSLI